MPKREPRRSGLAQAVGARLREIRLLRKVSQQRAADAVGLSQPALSLYESGARDIRVADLLALLDHFEVGLAEFMAEVPELLVLEDSAEIEIATKLIQDGLDRPAE